MVKIDAPTLNNLSEKSSYIEKKDLSDYYHGSYFWNKLESENTNFTVLSFLPLDQHPAETPI